MEEGLIPWIAHTIEQSLQLYINSDPDDPSTSSTLRKFGIQEVLSNIYLPAPKSQLVQVIKWWPCSEGRLSAQLSDSVNLIDATISQQSVRSSTPIDVTPVWRPGDIGEGAYLSLDRCQICIATCFEPPRISLQVEQLYPVSTKSFLPRRELTELSEETSISNLLRSHSLASRRVRGNRATENKKQIKMADEIENLLQNVPEHKNVADKQRSKGGLNSLVQNYRSVPRQPLGMNQNPSLNAKTLEALTKRHRPAQQSSDPVRINQTNGSPHRSSSRSEERKDTLFTQIAPENLTDPSSPLRAPQLSQTQRSAEELNTHSSQAIQNKSAEPPCLLRADQADHEKFASPSDKSEKNEIVRTFASEEKWSRMSSTIVSGRFLSRSMTVIPQTQEALLGKETSYWPPLTGQPKHESDVPNIPSKLLGAVLKVVDFAEPKATPLDEIGSSKDKDLNVEPELPNDHSEIDDEGEDLRSSSGEEENVSWSSSPPRLPPDSSPHLNNEDSPKLEEASTKSKVIENIMDDPPDDIDPSLAVTDLPSATRDPSSSPSRRGGSSEQISANHPGSDHVVCEEIEPSNKSIEPSLDPSQSSKNSDFQSKLGTEGRSPAIQVHRTPLPKTVHNANGQGANPVDAIGIEIGLEEDCGEVEAGSKLETITPDIEPISSGPSLPPQYNSTDDETRGLIHFEMDADCLSNSGHKIIHQPHSEDDLTYTPSANLMSKKISTGTVSELPGQRKSSDQTGPCTQPSSSLCRSGVSLPTSTPTSPGNLNNLKKSSVNRPSLQNSEQYFNLVKRSEYELSLVVTEAPPHHNSVDKMRGRSEYLHQSQKQDVVALASSSAPSIRERSNLKKRKRGTSDTGGDNSHRALSTQSMKEKLHPDGPEYRAAQVKREFFRQQARKRKTFESSREPSPATSGSPCGNAASQDLPLDANVGLGNSHIVVGNERWPWSTAFRGVYQRFRNAYPEYTADIERFSKACQSIKALRDNKEAPHPSLFDDFIIRRELEYTQYLRDMADEGNDAKPYVQYFDETEPKYSRRVLSVADLDTLSGASERKQTIMESNATVKTYTPPPTRSRPSTPQQEISEEHVSGEASPELPYSDRYGSESENNKERPVKTQKRKWYHDPNTEFKRWARAFSDREKPLIDKNGVTWRPSSAQAEKVVSIFKRQ